MPPIDFEQWESDPPPEVDVTVESLISWLQGQPQGAQVRILTSASGRPYVPVSVYQEGDVVWIDGEREDT